MVADRYIRAREFFPGEARQATDLADDPRNHQCSGSGHACNGLFLDDERSAFLGRGNRVVRECGRGAHRGRRRASPKEWASRIRWSVVMLSIVDA